MALNILRDTKTNEEAEVEGVWVDYLSDSRLKLARWDNEKAQTARFESYHNNEAILKSKDKDGGTTVADAKAKEIEINTLANYVLVGWEGIVDDEGNEIPYSSELAKEYLAESRDFRRDVTKMANSSTNYLESVIAKDVAKVKK